MTTKRNPYGKSAHGYKLVRAGAGTRTHIFDARAKHTLCGSGDPQELRASTATKITCYRCLKLDALNQQKAVVTRTLRAEKPKRSKHDMIVGGRQGKAVGAKKPRTPVPQPTAAFRPGPPGHPTQTRLSPQPSVLLFEDDVPAPKKKTPKRRR